MPRTAYSSAGPMRTSRAVIVRGTGTGVGEGVGVIGRHRRRGRCVGDGGGVRLSITVVVWSGGRARATASRARPMPTKLPRPKANRKVKRDELDPGHRNECSENGGNLTAHSLRKREQAASDCHHATGMAAHPLLASHASHRPKPSSIVILRNEESAASRVLTGLTRATAGSS